LATFAIDIFRDPTNVLIAIEELEQRTRGNFNNEALYEIFQLPTIYGWIY
jgi:hypothetical protein